MFVRGITCLVAVLAVGLLAAGCGGDDPSSAGGDSASAETGDGVNVQEAEQTVKRFMTPQPSSWEGPDSAPTPAAGKKVVVVSSNEVVEGSKRLSSGAMEAAKAIGWDATMCDGKGDPATQEQCTEVAIQQGADGIIWSAIDPAAAGGAVETAHKAGVPIITTYDFGGGDFELPPGVVADVSSDQCEAGKVTAAYMVANSEDGKPKVAMVTGKEYPIVRVRAQCAREALEAAGADIVDEQDLRSADVATKGPSIASALVSQYPAGELDYIWAPYDAAALFFANGIDSSGRDDVKIVGFDANEANLDMIANGGAEAATMGSELEWAGWAAIDLMNREFAGDSTDVSYGVPIQLYTEQNAANPKPPLDFEAKFAQLWGKG